MLAKGSRALAYVGIAKTIHEAEKIAEDKMRKITGEFFHRPDIGTEKSLLNKIRYDARIEVNTRMRLGILGSTRGSALLPLLEAMQERKLNATFLSF
jgi:hypothetical protein